MARIGAFCFPGTGHLNPLTALARRLERRGHSVVIFGVADVESRVKSAGIEFCLIGQSDYPPGTLRKLDRRLGELKGLEILGFILERVKNTARMVFRDGPEAVRRANVEALLVDEADMGGTVADCLHLPFVSLALIPPMVWDNRAPPFCFGWPARRGWMSRLRNEIALRVLARAAAPLLALINQQRAAWGLKPLKRLSETLSTLAQITQVPGASSLMWSTLDLRYSTTQARGWMLNSGPGWTLIGTGWTAAHWSTQLLARCKTERRKSFASSPAHARACLSNW